jgi:hypothetical protein
MLGFLLLHTPVRIDRLATGSIVALASYRDL